MDFIAILDLVLWSLQNIISSYSVIGETFFWFFFVAFVIAVVRTLWERVCG